MMQDQAEEEEGGGGQTEKGEGSRHLHNESYIVIIPSFYPQT